MKRHVLLSDQDDDLIWIEERVGRVGRWAIRHPLAARRAQDALLIAAIWAVLIAAWWAGSSL
jgi:hypothetical protein